MTQSSSTRPTSQAELPDDESIEQQPLANRLANALLCSNGDEDIRLALADEYRPYISHCAPAPFQRGGAVLFFTDGSVLVMKPATESLNVYESLLDFIFSDDGSGFRAEDDEPTLPQETPHA